MNPPQSKDTLSTNEKRLTLALTPTPISPDLSGRVDKRVEDPKEEDGGGGS